MMSLLVDIGNTRIKWAVEENGEIISGLPIVYKQSGFEEVIKQCWHSLKIPGILAISSVTENQTAQVVIDIARRLWPGIQVIIAQSSAQDFSVNNAYPQPEKLGVDRWLNLIALQFYYPGNSSVVDCGTAITIDSINSKGQHLGGLISPGIQLMKQALYQGAEDLNISDKQYPVALSCTTSSAIYSGILYAASGLIEKTMNDLCDSKTWVLTGGDAHLLAPYLNLECIIEVDFVLKGLSLYCKKEEMK